MGTNFKKQIMKTLKFEILVFISLVCFSSCEKETKKYEVNGLAQKGPFLAGTNITIAELEEDLKPTGKSFFSTVSDNKGNFSIPNVDFSSSYVELISDGYYYHESRGEDTEERITLKCIADLSNASTININILTHLGSERIKYLIQNKNFDYPRAKAQTEKEILKIFSIETEDPGNFEYLDLSEAGELNSLLLAVSCIVQSEKSVQNLTQFLTNFNQDIKEDGILDNEEIKTELATSAVLLNTGSIRRNLSELYEDTIFDHFQESVRQFLDNTGFEPAYKFDFAANSGFGKNLINIPDNSVLNTDSIFCIALGGIENLANFGFMLTIEKINGTGVFSYTNNDLTGWSLNEESDTKINLTNTSTSQYENVPLNITFSGNGEIRISILIESSDFPEPFIYFIDKYFKW